MKRFIFVVLCFSLSIYTLPAQSNQMIDTLLNTQHTNLYQVAYILAYAVNSVPENEIDEAFLKLLADKEDYFLYKDSSAAITTGELSLAIMAMLDLKGGIMYSIFKSPHYAYNELVFKGIVTKEVKEKDSFSGESMLKTVQKALLWKEKYLK